jgi:hypothetical protein
MDCCGSRWTWVDWTQRLPRPFVFRSADGNTRRPAWVERRGRVEPWPCAWITSLRTSTGRGPPPAPEWHRKRAPPPSAISTAGLPRRPRTRRVAARGSTCSADRAPAPPPAGAGPIRGDSEVRDASETRAMHKRYLSRTEAPARARSSTLTGPRAHQRDSAGLRARARPPPPAGAGPIRGDSEGATPSPRGRARVPSAGTPRDGDASGEGVPGP